MGADRTLRVVWHEGPFVIREFPDVKPYYEVLAGHCSLRDMDRDVVAGSCSGPARLLRRELFFPGWTARINAGSAALRQSNEIFQEIDLPAGQFMSTFAYRPPYIGVAWFASICGLVGLVLGWTNGWIRLRRGVPRREAHAATVAPDHGPAS